MKKFFLLLLILVLCSCSVKREVAEVWSYIQERPDSALSVLNSLDVSSYHGRTLAEYRLLKAMALDKNYIDVASDSLAGPAVEYFRSHGPEEKEMLSLYYLGMTQYYGKDPEKAIVTLGNVREMARNLRDERYEALSCIHLSYLYCNDRNYEDAIRMARESIKCFSNQPDSTYQLKWASLHLADCYHNFHCLEEAVDILYPLVHKDSQDTLFLRKGLISYSWSLFLSDNKKVEESLYCFEKAVRTYHASPGERDYHHYGVMLLAANRELEARQVLNVLKKHSVSPEFVQDLEYRIMKRRGNYKGALETYESLLQLQNEVALQTMSQSLVRTQRDYQSIIREKAENEMRWERKKGILLSMFFVLTIISFLIVMLVWRRLVVERKNRLVSSIEEANRLLDNLQGKNEELSGELEVARMKYVAAYKKQFQKMGTLVACYYSTSDKKNSRELIYRQVMDLSVTVGKDRKSMRNLERSVNRALENAFDLYCEDFPGMKESHYDLVCYFMAGFPASLIEVLTGMNKNTIYSKKQRLLETIEKSACDHCELLIRAIQ